MSSPAIPQISICLPTLNPGKYLHDRWDSIRDQTFQDWELIVCDSQSDDGSWDYLLKVASEDPRVHLHQTPRKGIYAGINECIARSNGEYIYIATGDDTMSPECLGKMISTLEENPDCGLCQCGLEIIDEQGEAVSGEMQWVHYTLGKYNPGLVAKKNKRLAPHDGYLHPALLTIYTSLTQLLIRKKVFKRCGLFESRWGAIGDFEWGMRVGLLENCISIPENLATWRIHPSQATSHDDINDNFRRTQMLEMVHAAVDRAKELEPDKLDSLSAKTLGFFLERDLMQFSVGSYLDHQTSLLEILRMVARQPRAFFLHLRDAVMKRSWGQWHNGDRYDMLKSLLRKDAVPQPVFLD